MAKAVAKVEPEQNTGVAVYDYGDYAGEGFDDRSSTDYSIPFLYVLQPLSPAIAEGTLEGAKAGQFLNTVTNDLMDSLRFIWCFDDHKYVEWIPKDAGGGIAGTHDLDSVIVQEAIRKNGGSRIGSLKHGANDLIETRYVYGLTLDENDEVTGFAVIPAKSTNLKPVQNWLTSMRFVKNKPPIYAFRAVLKTSKEKNEKGVWFQLKPEPVGGNWKEALINPASHGHLLAEAKSFREMVISGRAKADLSQEAKMGNAGSSTANVADGTREVPF